MPAYCSSKKSLSALTVASSIPPLLPSRVGWLFVHLQNDEQARRVARDFIDKMPFYLAYLDFPEAPNTTCRLERLFKDIKENKAVKGAKSCEAKEETIDLVIKRNKVGPLNRSKQPDTQSYDT